MKRAAALFVAMALMVGCGGAKARQPAAQPQQAAAQAELKRAQPKAPAAQAGDQPVKAQRGEMTAVMVEKGPAVDGTLNDSAWTKCPPLELGECTSAKPGPAKTVARVLFDATHLYVGFECDEPDMPSLVKNETTRDADVWKDDNVEVFVSGDPRMGYFHFAVNPKGVLFDAKFKAGGKDDGSYNSKAQAKAATQANRWVVTMSIPLTDVGAYVGQGQTWSLNLNRTKPGETAAVSAAEWSWAIMGTNDYHQVLDYGKVTGVNVPSREDGVTRTASAPPAPPAYDKGKQAGDVLVYKRVEELIMPESGAGGIAKEIPLMIRGSDGLKVAFVARGLNGAEYASFNMSDARSNDNTTSKSYRVLDAQWRPMLYRVDRFRYNGTPNLESSIGKDTDFRNVRFHGNATEAKKAALEIKNFVIYRGEDKTPPLAVEDVQAGTAGSAGGVKLTWKPAVDNVGAGLYVISRAGADGKFVKVGESCLPEFVDKPEQVGTYKYRVLAVDFQDNIGSWSREAAFKCDKAAPAPASQPAVIADRAGYAEAVKQIAKAGAGKVRKGVVLCFGDSLTGATSYRIFVESSLAHYLVEARGYPSMRTDFGKGQVGKELSGVNPQYCLILYGTNNGKDAKSIESAMVDLVAIANSCKENGTIPIIGTIPPRAFTDAKSTGEANYNEALVKTCRANQIPVAYVFEAFQASGAPDKIIEQRKTMVASDGVHLMDGGWAVTAPAWEAALRQVNWVLLDRE